MGSVGAAKALLETMTGISRGESRAKLLRHYQRWGQLNTNADPIPAAYNENDQTKYAGLYIAQEMAAACAHGRQYESRGRGCFRFLHDGQRRCGGGCSSAAMSRHSLAHRIALDRGNELFENMFHSGQHTVSAKGKLTKPGTTPLVLHYNGPAKVVFESSWGLSHLWNPKSGKTPVLLHIEGLRAPHAAAARAEAMAAFEHNVTLVDPLLRKARGSGPLRYSCAVD